MMSDVQKARDASAVAPPKSQGSDLTDRDLLREFKARFNRGAFDHDDLSFARDFEPAEIEDSNAFDEARHRWQRGDKREALHYLEIALGRDFYGLERVML